MIVVESNSITIYDGDDPSLPLWWSYVGNTSFSGGSPFYTNTLDDNSGASVTALNGSIILGVPYSNINGGVRKFDFIADRMKRYTQSTSASTNGSIAPLTAMGSVGAIPDGENIQIVNYTVNDVAMTVLPNAPIDADTGLPVPTIAVATDGGVSVIKDDGSVVDIVSSTAAGGGYDPEHVAFDKDNRLTLVQAYDAAAPYLNIFENIPSADVAQALSYSGATSYTYLDTGLNISGGSANIADLAHAKDEVALGFNTRLSILDSIPGAPTKSMVAYITSDYNTGWMNGDIKLATLSDTDTTNVTGSELSNVSSFTDLSGIGNSVSESGGTVTGTYGGSGGLCHYKGALFSTVAGNTYTVVINHTGGSTCTFGVKDGGTDAGIISKGSLTTVGIVSITFTAIGTSAYMEFYNNNSFVFSSLSIRADEFDRSVNNNGLQVFGTVTKTAVATGADLVGYSGFSSSNYLAQPYNSDLDFGTGDFCVMHWFNASSIATTQRMGGRADGATNKRFDIYLNGTSIVVYSADSGAATSVQYSGVSLNQWNFVVFVRIGNIHNLYLNGVVVASTTGTVRNISSGQNEPWTIGAMSFNGGVNYEPASTTAIALYRVTATTPSAEQIAKIYNDEKFLFQENTKATLYGSSDAVTALAYDDDTELLHVGTSAGRSEFQGLRRVNNTTDAVGAAISASNGFIVEE